MSLSLHTQDSVRILCLVYSAVLKTKLIILFLFLLTSVTPVLQCLQCQPCWSLNFSFPHCLHFYWKVWYFIAIITTGFVNFIHGLIWIILFVSQLVDRPSSTWSPDFSHLIPVIWEYHLGDLCVDPVVVGTTVTTIILV